MITHKAPWTRKDSTDNTIQYHIHPITGHTTILCPKEKNEKDFEGYLEIFAPEILGVLLTAKSIQNPLDGTQPIDFFGHKLEVHTDARPGHFQRFGSILHVGGSQNNATDLIKKFYQEECVKQAQKIIRPMVEKTQKQCVSISAVDSIGSWGKCKSARKIDLSWRLCMAPIGVFHYVCAHEAAHLTHMNHSQKFWSLCESLTPHRKASEEWLKENGQRIMIAGRHLPIAYWAKKATEK